MINDIAINDNPSTRCPVVFLIDASNSMNEVVANEGKPTGHKFFSDGQMWEEIDGGESRIDKLNEGLRTFFKAIAKDEVAKYSVEVKILSFGDSVKHESDFVTFSDIASYTPTEIFPEGETALGTALNEGLKILEDRKKFYRDNGVSYYQPWMVLMTDGKPTDQWQQAAAKAKELAANSKLNFFGVGIGKNYDAKCLSQILPVNRPPLELNETKFNEFFEWLSSSLIQASASASGEQVNLPSVDGWAQLIV